MSVEVNLFPHRQTDREYGTVVLSGGAEKGFVHLGVLHHHHLRGTLRGVTSWIGTSIGGILAILLCAGYSPADIFMEIYSQDVRPQYSFATIRSFLTTYGIMEAESFYGVVERMLARKFDGRVPTLREMYVCTNKFVEVAAYNLTMHRLEFVSHETHPDVSAMDAARMTSCVPFILPRLDVGGHTYIDGSLVCDFAIERALEGSTGVSGGAVLGVNIEKITSLTSSRAVVGFIYSILMLPVQMNKFELAKFRAHRRRRHNVDTPVDIVSVAVHSPSTFGIGQSDAGFRATQLAYFIEAYASLVPPSVGAAGEQREQRQLVVAFYLHTLTYRGTEVAVYDYAFYNKHLLGNESVVFVLSTVREIDVDVFYKFSLQFRVEVCDSFADIDRRCRELGAACLYSLEHGGAPGPTSPPPDQFQHARVVVHCVFEATRPRGSVYAAISPSVAATAPEGAAVPVVPHIVRDLHPTTETMRARLGIPADAVVFGRHGSPRTLDPRFVGAAAAQVLADEPSVWFLFTGMPLAFAAASPALHAHPRVVCIDPFVAAADRRRFINTCDAMLHACSIGESFGLSVLEFCKCGKPVVVFDNRTVSVRGAPSHTQHLDHLGEKALLFTDAGSLRAQMMRVVRREVVRVDYGELNERYAPERVMPIFKSVFLDAQ